MRAVRVIGRKPTNILYLCKRCGHCFEYESFLRRHQTNKSVCQTNCDLTSFANNWAAAQIRYQKNVEAAGVEEYLKTVVKRAMKQEILCVLEAASCADLAVLFELVERARPALLFKIVAVMSDFVNQDTASLQKAALIGAFVDRNITL